MTINILRPFKHLKHLKGSISFLEIYDDLYFATFHSDPKITPYFPKLPKRDESPPTINE